MDTTQSEITPVPFEAMKNIKAKLIKLDSGWTKMVAIEMLVREGFNRESLEKVSEGKVTDEIALQVINKKVVEVKNIFGTPKRHNSIQKKAIIAADAVVVRLEKEQSQALAAANKYI